MKIPVHSLLKSDATGMVFRFETMQTELPAAAAVETHRHDYYEIFIFENGGGSHFIDFTDFEIKPQHLHFIVPGQVHHLKRLKGSSGYVIMFSREVFHIYHHDKIEFVDLPFFNGSYPSPLQCNKDEFNSLLSLIKIMENESKYNHTFKNEVLQSYLKILLLKAKSIFELAHPFPSKVDNATYNWCVKFQQLIELHFKEKHLVNEYAALIGITPNQLNESCKKVLDKNAGEMIKERLVLESKRLLMHSSLTQKQIAYELNFNDPSHFSKFFKTQTGQTPNDFCENITKKYNHS